LVDYFDGTHASKVACAASSARCFAETPPLSRAIGEAKSLGEVDEPKK